jgi:acetate kinase
MPHSPIIVLVVNCGGATFKYKLYEISHGTERVLAVGHVDRLGSNNGLLRHKLPERNVEIRAELPMPDHRNWFRLSTAPWNPWMQSALSAIKSRTTA